MNEKLAAFLADHPDLAPWQIDFLERLDRGEQAIFQRPRQAGHQQMTDLICAYAEAVGMRWDVVGPTAKDTRRRARELAARLTEPPQ